MRIVPASRWRRLPGATWRSAQSRSATAASDGVDHQDGGDEVEGEARAERLGELHGGERRDGGAAHARTEGAEGQAAPLRREPRVDEGHADGERRAAEPEEEAADQVGGERVGEVPEVEHGQDGQQGHRREHPPRAEPVGERADRDPAERADQHRYGDQQRLLEGGQAELLTQRRAERRQQCPRPEGQGEADRCHRQHQPGAPAHRGVRTGRDAIRPGRRQSLAHRSHSSALYAAEPVCAASARPFEDGSDPSGSTESGARRSMGRRPVYSGQVPRRDPRRGRSSRGHAATGCRTGNTRPPGGRRAMTDAAARAVSDARGR